MFEPYTHTKSKKISSLVEKIKKKEFKKRKLIRDVNDGRVGGVGGAATLVIRQTATAPFDKDEICKTMLETKKCKYR